MFHAAATYDGTTMRLYKNGVVVAALDNNEDIAGHGEGIWIEGNPNVAMSPHWNGLISDVRVYQQALTNQDSGLDVKLLTNISKIF